MTHTDPTGIMRFFKFVSRNPKRFSALFCLTLAAATACGGGDPQVHQPDSTVSESGSTVVGKGGTSATNGGSSTGGSNGPVIVVPEGGACAEGCAEDKVVCGDGVL